MESTSNYFAESIGDFAMLDNHQSNFDFQAISSSSPDDEDENEDEVKGGDSNEASGDDNPPLDENVVHSPVLPQTGGKPR